MSMFRSVVVLGLAVSGLQTGIQTDLNSTQLAQTSTDILPNIAPYNFMTDVTPSAAAEGRFVIPINTRYKQARVVYSNDSDPKIIGFDLYIRGKPLGMVPLAKNESVLVSATYTGFSLGFPLDPQAWESTQIKQKFVNPKFTKREKFMCNENADFYCRFRTSNPNQEDLAKQLDGLSKGDNLSINGITKVKSLVIASDHRGSRLSQSFENSALGTIYLDAEYDELVIMSERVGRWGTAGQSMAFIFPSVLLFACIFCLILFICHRKTLLILVSLAPTVALTSILCWAGVVWTRYSG